MGSFYGRYKTDPVRDHIFTDEDELRPNIFDYIEVFYNRFRKHSSLGLSQSDPGGIEKIAPWGHPYFLSGNLTHNASNKR